MIARITAQACRQTGLSLVCQDLLDFDGDEIYFQPGEQLVGRTFGESLLVYDSSSVIGLRRAGGEVLVNPPMATTFATGDAVIAISADDDTVVFSGFRDDLDALRAPVAGPPDTGPQRILVVGWSALGGVVLRELDQFAAAGSTADVIVDDALVAVGALDDLGLTRLRATVHPAHGDIDRMTVFLAGQHFHHIVILGYRSGLTPSQADARTLLTLVLLRQAGRPTDEPTRVVAEILDSRDIELAQATGADDFIVSDALSSYMIAQLAENPELDAVFTDLFDAEGSAIALKPAAWYVEPGAMRPFAEVVAGARARGEVAIGYRRVGDDGEPVLVVNPPKDDVTTLTAGDRVAVIGPPE